MRLRRGDQDIAALEVAATARARTRGLLGRDDIDGALWLEPARSVHTVGMCFAIDVAHLDRHGRILRLTTMPPGRVGRIVWRARTVVEAGEGAFGRWGLAVGDRLEIGVAGVPAASSGGAGGERP